MALESDLLEEFDRLIARRGYPSRSEAFRDLIRDALTAESTQADTTPVVGSVTLVYDHHVRNLGDKLTALQHQYHDAVVSTMHVHLDHDNCLEVIVLRGQARHVKALADGLISTKGVRHGRLTVAGSDPEAGSKAESKAAKKKPGPHRHTGADGRSVTHSHD